MTVAFSYQPTEPKPRSVDNSIWFGPVLRVFRTFRKRKRKKLIGTGKSDIDKINREAKEGKKSKNKVSMNFGEKKEIKFKVAVFAFNILNSFYFCLRFNGIICSKLMILHSSVKFLIVRSLLMAW